MTVYDRKESCQKRSGQTGPSHSEDQDVKAVMGDRGQRIQRRHPSSGGGRFGRAQANDQTNEHHRGDDDPRRHVQPESDQLGRVSIGYVGES